MTLRMTRHLSVVISCFLCFFSQGQTIQEIEEKLLLSESDTSKVQWHYLLSWKLRKIDFKSAKYHAKQGLKISEKHQRKEDIATGLNRLGIVYKNEGKLDSAIHCYTVALETEQSINNQFGIGRAYYQLSKAYKKIGDEKTALKYAQLNLEYMLKAGEPRDIANSRTGLAILQTRKGEFQKALKNYLKALTVFESIESLNGQANVHQDLGNLYEILEEYPKAKKHHVKSMDLYRQIGDLWGVADAHNNIGNIYFLQHNYDTAEVHYKKSIQLKQEFSDTEGIQGSYYNLGLILEGKNEHQNAIELHLANLDEAKQFNDSTAMGKIYYALGTNYTAVGNYSEAVKVLKNAYSLAITRGHKPDLLSICEALSSAYSKAGKFDKAYLYMGEYHVLRDELIAEYKKSKNLEQKIEQSKFEKIRLSKEIEISNRKLHEAELEKRNETILLYTFIGGITAAIVLFVFWFRGYRNRQGLLLRAKDAEIRQQEFEDLLKEKELLYRNSVIEAQEKERTRISEELHDHLGGLLSTVKLHFKSVEEKVDGIAIQLGEPYFKANELLDKACEEVRVISHRMASVELEKYGLILELQELFETIRLSGKLEIITNYHNMKERLPINLEREIYKTIRELTTNIVKHSKATKMHVSLIRHNGHLTIMVEDNGIGFKTDVVQKGLGFIQIERRFKQLSGKINIDSGRGNGTTISIDVPIKNA